MLLQYVPNKFYRVVPYNLLFFPKISYPFPHLTFQPRYYREDDIDSPFSSLQLDILPQLGGNGKELYTPLRCCITLEN